MIELAEWATIFYILSFFLAQHKKFFQTLNIHISKLLCLYICFFCDIVVILFIVFCFFFYITSFLIY